MKWVAAVRIGVARPGDDPRLGELFMIYVLPTESGHGIGRELMSAALARFREERFREAILWVIEDNPRTRRFYELAGWHVDGGAQTEEWLGTRIQEVRYRITL